MALVTIEKLKGKETIESYSPLSKIGMVYQTQGKFNEALEFYRKALAIKEKKGKDTIDCSASLNSIGTVYNDQNEFN